MIRPTDRFTLDTREADNTARSELFAAGVPIGRVRGSHIDAQFSVGDDGHVLFVSFDDMFSAIETIYFIDFGGRFRDEVKLGNEFTQGLITEIKIDGHDRISFDFPLNESHVLRIGRAPRLFGIGQRWLHLDT